MSKSTALISQSLINEAEAIDKELRDQWKRMKKQGRVVGGLFKKIRDSELHKFIRNPNSKKGYQSFEDYVNDVTGGIAHATIWVLMRIHELTQGPNPLLADDVDAMSQQNAYELTKLKPEHRTPEIVQKAMKTPIKKFQAQVQEINNATLPPEKRKPVLVEVYEKWPPQLLDMFEEAVSDFSLLSVVRDGDRDLAIRHKAIAAIVISARTYASDEIRAAKAELSAEESEIIGTQKADWIEVASPTAGHRTRRIIRRSSEAAR